MTLVVSASACKRSQQGPPSSQSSAEPENMAVPVAHETRSERIVAIGDVHGDLAATKRALRLAGLIDAQDRWSGGATVLVQTGDLLDRGDDEPEILELFWRLQKEAPSTGGRVELLLGNHEVMNVQGDLRYVTPDGFDDYAQTPIPAHWPKVDEGALGLKPGTLARRAAFAPGSSIARRFAEQKIAVVVGDTLFVHGGLSPGHAHQGIDAINSEATAWLAGRSAIPRALQESSGPLWNRDYGDAPDEEDCASLTRTLDAVGAKRMVVGHTVQRSGINAACDQKVWRIDVGMARHYGGDTEVLEILGDEVRVITSQS